MNWHEIVKYSPQKYDSNGIYTDDGAGTVDADQEK